MENFKVSTIISSVLSLVVLCSSLSGMKEESGTGSFTPEKIQELELVKEFFFIKEISEKPYVKKINNNIFMQLNLTSIRHNLALDVVHNKKLDKTGKRKFFIYFLKSFEIYTTNLIEHITTKKGFFNEKFESLSRQACIDMYEDFLTTLHNHYEYLFITSERKSKLTKWIETNYLHGKGVIQDYEDPYFGKKFEDEICSKNLCDDTDLQNGYDKKTYKEVYQEMSKKKRNTLSFWNKYNNGLVNRFKKAINSNNDKVKISKNKKKNKVIDITSSSEEGDSSDDNESRDFKNNRIVKGDEYKKLLQNVLGDDSGEDNSEDSSSSYDPKDDLSSSDDERSN